ncbi:NHL repeat-containing protein 2-like [Corticium candelabrum]|uniref:NHL repeat-containing protein 2-like n=1 Tax=Corticium candelabrum TaxID=121492 RepID=UPI002E26275F|nr:NHL repeat-containing protein 2-like [Corticium candelabrum]
MSATSVNVSTVAGSLQGGHRDGAGRDALFYNPIGLAFTNSGDIIVADWSNHCIRKVMLPRGDDISSHVETIAGVAGQCGYRNGTADQALFNNPSSVAVGEDDTIYVTDRGNNRIRTVDGCDKVKTLAGSENKGLVDGQGSSASFTELRDITQSANKSIFYITDHHCIRKIDIAGNVITIAGQQAEGLTDGHCSEAKFYWPRQIACRSGDDETLYVADYFNHAVREVSLNTRNVRTIAGGKGAGSCDGAIEVATLNRPYGITIDSKGCIFVCDRYNHKIRIIFSTMETMTTLVGCGEKGLVDGNGEEAKLENPCCLLLNESTHTLYFTQQHCIRKVDLQQYFIPPLPNLDVSLGEDQMFLVDNKDLADVVFQVEDKQIFAYKPILIARNSYFSGLFSSGMKESHPSGDGHVTTIPIQDASYDAFRALIVYLITDKVSVDVNDWKMVWQLLILSDRFLVSKLKSYCEQIVARHIRVENAVEVLCLSDTHNTPLLKEQAITFICNHLDVMRGRAEMEQLSSSLLLEIIRK